MTDLSCCWHLLTQKRIFCVPSLINGLAGQLTFGPAET